MIIDSLSMCDFRAFNGAHHFDLSPKIKRGKRTPIVLFGGLNGGGKTTILNALKLALYGKGVRGSSASLADYHQYLRECIHRAPNGIVQPTKAAVELTFRYAQHGVLSNYHVKRDWWIDHNDKVKEGLLISKDAKELSELTYDQAQSFLNELIPIGVSELFFFDGEKIANLAEETTGETLRESINKLLGLDIIDRLDSDLAVLVRTRAQKSTSEERRDKISSNEKEFTDVLGKIEDVRNRLAQLRTEIGEASANITLIDGQINSRGGAWITSKQEESLRLEHLHHRKAALEEELKTLASGLLPIGIARKLADRALKQLDSERQDREALAMADFVMRQESAFLKAMKKTLSLGRDEEAIVKSIYLETFKEAIQAGEKSDKPVHDLSDSRIASIADRFNRALKLDQKRCTELTNELDEVDSEIDALGANMARAPDENILLPLLKKQAAHQERLGSLKARREHLATEAKELFSRLSQIARKLDELHADASKSAENDRVFTMATQTRSVLKEFSAKARESKLKELEVQFYASFNRLARKEDRHLSIRIDPHSFEVALLDEFGGVIRKHELSAGEKQIYAISVLEALARTSGRSLPVIIDTPLGRLDSVHRRKLVENYFPKTSHQVLVLSTDTEIDRSFYEELGPHISHAYHLIYNPETRSTRVEAGYFWRQKEAV